MGPIALSPRTAVVALVSLALVLVLAVVACAGGSSTPTPTPAPTPSPAPSRAPTSTPTMPPTAIPSSTPLPTASAPGSPAFLASLVPSGSPEVTSARVCADLAAFQSALDVLKGLDPKTARARGVVEAVSAAVTTGMALVESAKAAFGPEAQALGTALSGLQSALQGITGEGTLLDKAATVENAIDEVAAAFDALKADVGPGCAGPEAS